LNTISKTVRQVLNTVPAPKGLRELNPRENLLR